jgi:rod shape-determining protein MreB
LFTPLNWLFSLFSLDIGIDLGTANTLVSVRGRGIVINEPSWVAIDKRSRKSLAIGAEARQMVGRTPANIIAIRPLRDGVISEFEITQAMLEYFIGKAHEQSLVPLPRPRVVVGVPSGVTEVEKRAVYDATMSAGAREAFLIEEPMAAAIGAGLPVHEPTGNMIVDIGGGTTEVAVISLGGIVTSVSVRVGGDELDEAVMSYVKKHHSLMLGERTAEEIKLAIGSAHPLEEELRAEIRGRDLVSGLPKTVLVDDTEIREAIEEPVSSIVAAVRNTLDRTPPELASDIMERGIVVAGGGALLRGLVDRFHEDTGMPVRLAPEPLQAVAEGSGKCLEEFEALRRVLVSTSRH